MKALLALRSVGSYVGQSQMCLNVGGFSIFFSVFLQQIYDCRFFFFQFAPNVLFTQQIYNIRKYNVKFHKIVDENLDFYSVVEITILFLKMQAFWIKISYFNINHGSALLTIGFSTA